MTTRVKASKKTTVRKMPRGLTQAKIKDHVIEPAHTMDIVSDGELEAVEPTFKAKNRPRPKVPAGGTAKKLNVTKFGENINSVLGSLGYALQIRQNGVPIWGVASGWARTPQNGSVPWTGDRRMHIASVSKLLTAIGLFKLLNSKSQVSLDSNIIDFLPAYWVKGANVDKIKFKHLLRHKSGIGFLLPGQSSKSNFAFMKANIARGVIEPGSKRSYQNANFGLMRILMAVVNGDIDTDYDPGSNRDTMWDVHTIAYYRDYMQDHIFTPAGVANAGFAALPGGALAYAFPPGQGWNSGDLQSVSGGAGWRLSVGELLNVMDHFRRRSTILTPDLAQKVLDRRYGNDHLPTLAGKVFYKKGSWGNNGRHEKAIAYFLPEDMEMVIFVNSQVFAQGFALGNIVEDLYKNALE